MEREKWKERKGRNEKKEKKIIESNIYISTNATIYCPYLLDDTATIHLKAKCQNMTKKFVG